MDLDGILSKISLISDDFYRSKKTSKHEKLSSSEYKKLLLIPYSVIWKEQEKLLNLLFIIEMNKKLSDTPETVNSDPYGDGWMIKAEISNLADLNDLLDANSYKTLIGQ
ncbi:MAG: hypothetical protein OQJ78_01595 [Ignavibacteriaceae bacterium]|nr:hypothetical protein [Ignavibacteriaceae bacterium]